LPRLRGSRYRATGGRIIAIIYRTVGNRYEYLGQRGKPIKTKQSARLFKTVQAARRHIDAMPPDERDGWRAGSEYGPSLVNPK
jgi:hypothetical protein